jgi:hypothetical protein
LKVRYYIFNLFKSANPQLIAEVRVCSCGAEFHDKIAELKLLTAEKNVIAVIRACIISLKSCGHEVAEVLPSNCGSENVDIK